MRKIILISFILIAASCSRKFQTFHTIEKSTFLFGQEHSPIAHRLQPGQKQTREFCNGQWLFSNNAVRDTQEQLNRVVRYTCDKDKYLINSVVTETWWTTLIYSRACIEFETHCPR